MSPYNPSKLTNYLAIIKMIFINQIYPTGSDYLVSCDDKNCTDHCECTHIVKLKKDAVIQIILNNQGIVTSCYCMQVEIENIKIQRTARYINGVTVKLEAELSRSIIILYHKTLFVMENAINTCQT